jgi:hypothetical protein
VRFRWDTHAGHAPLVLAFCASHAENKAVHAELDWIAVGYTVCQFCWRVLPTPMASAEHFDLDGLACPPPLRAVAST